MVIGAGGRIGSVLRQRLSLFDDVTTIPVYGPRGQIPEQGRRLDVLDKRAVNALIETERPDAIVHLVGLSGAAVMTDPGRTIAVNVGSIETVAAASARFGVRRLVFPSSSAVYGDEYSSPIAESGPINIRSLYAETKIRGEDALRSVSQLESGPSSIILRIFNVFGPGLGASLVERLLASTPVNPVTLRGPANFVRDYSHVEDIAQVVISALALPSKHQDLTLNIGSGVAVSNEQLLWALEGRQKVHFVTAEGPTSYSCANIAAAKSILGFAPSGLVEFSQT